MRQIKLHARNYLRRTNLSLCVDEEKVQFINGIAVVNASTRDKREYFGIINEEYEEVFDDEKAYGEARRNLMFLGYNQNIFRCGENDFIVKVCVGDEYHYHYEYRHIRIENMKSVLINKNIGEYTKTNDENILIIGGNFNWCNKTLYNIAEGKHIDGKYDEITMVDGYKNIFLVKKTITSLTQDSSKDDLSLADQLYFQIDQNGHIVSKVFSKGKLEFLDYGDMGIDDYSKYRKQELIEESEKLKAAVYSLKKYK